MPESAMSLEPETDLASSISEDDMTTLEAMFSGELPPDPVTEDEPEVEVAEDEDEADVEPAPAVDEAEEAAEAEATEEEPPAPAQDPDVISRLESIASSERELSRRRREFDTQRTDVSQREAALVAREEKAAAYDEFIKQIEEGDPLEALMSRGIDFETLAKGVASGQGVRPNRAIEDRQTKLENELKQYRESEAASVRAADQVNRDRAALAEIAQMAEERDPVVAAMGTDGQNLILQMARKAVQETGRVPDYDTLFKDARKSALGFIERFKDLPEVQEMFGARPDGKPTKKQAASKTVSNKTATKVAKRKNEDVDLDSLSAEDQYDALFG